MTAPVSEEKFEKELHVSWYIVAYKFLFGLTELLLGAGITIFGSAAVSWYRVISVQELSEDPHDVLIRLTESVIPHVFAPHTFISVYLILLGTAKIAGAIGLVYKQYWGIDLLVGLTFVMLPFQLVQLIMHPSVADLLYIVTGLLIALYLINFHPREWAAHISNRTRGHHKIGPPSNTL